MKRNVFYHHAWLRLCLYALFAVPAVLSGCNKLPAEHTIVTGENGVIQLPLNTVNDGKVHFYTYRMNGKRINFLVRTDRNKRLSAHFDACFTCSKSKKGYRVEGADLVCNECNLRFPVAEEHWDNSTGCSPVLLKSTVDNEYLRIVTADIEKGAKLF